MNSRRSPAIGGPRRRKKFDNILSQAQRLAGTYMGTSEQERCLFEVLGELEVIHARISATIPELAGAGLDRNAVESRVSTELTGSADATVNALIDRAIESLRILLDPDADLADIAKRLGIAYQHLNRVFTAPGPIPQAVPNRGGSPIERPKLGARLQEVLIELNRRGICLDDFIIRDGELDPKQWRGKTYVLIDIPCLNKQVFLCNEIKEAAFVSQQILDPHLYESKKSELAEMPGITRIERYDLQTVMSLLFDEGRVVTEKVDVKAQEELRQQIQAKFTTEQWAAMGQGEQIGVVAGGKKQKAILRTFGIAALSKTRLAHLLIGRAVWGAGNPHIEPLLQAAERKEHLLTHPQNLIAEVKLARTPEQWAANRSERNRSKSALDDIGLVSMAVTLGIQGNPNSDEVVYLRLGAAIFGRGDPILSPLLDELEPLADRQKELLRKRRAWRRVVRADKSAAEWVAMPQPEKAAWSVHGRSAHWMATTFGIQENILSNRLAWLRLGAAIWGEKHPQIAQALKVLEDRAAQIAKGPEHWKQRLRESWQVEKFMALGRNERRNFESDGMPIDVLANHVFNTGGRPGSVHYDWARLAAEVWGTEHPAIKPVLVKGAEKQIGREIKRDRNAWMQAVREAYTHQRLIELARSKEERESVIVHERRIRFLCTTILGPGGKDPRENEERYLEWVRTVYSEEETKTK